jgi:crotonobetainyl-CoA:carnitine CoA-transferase CaiB-like acyl-CoA transferase
MLRGFQTKRTVVRTRRALLIVTPMPTKPADPRPPLQGLKVLDVATIYAGPLAAMFLGDYGAEVIKVEHPRGDPARSHGHSKDGHGLWWKVLGRNKLAITLDFSKPAGQELLARLVADADVLIENFRPGVLERWDLGPERLHELNPRLIVLRVTGFGQHGPYAKRRAFGTLAEAMSGFAHMTGEPHGPPTLPPFGLADGLAGLAGALAVMFALRHRDAVTGQGQVVDLALIEPILTVLGPAPSAYDQLGIIPRRHGNRSTNNAPRNTYQTRDGRWVAISASATTVAERVLRLVGHPEVVEQPWFLSAGQRVQHADELDEMVGSWIGARDFEEVTKAFEAAGAAIAPVYDVAQLMADPQIEALRSIVTIQDEDLGPLKMQNVMFRMSETPGAIAFGGRRLGQDNEAVYCGRLGLSREYLDDLKGAGVV